MKNRVKVGILLLVLTAIYCFVTAMFIGDFGVVMLGWCISFVATICCAKADISNDSKDNWFDKTKLW
jgi:hypothetical protein